jgi:TonB-linked SusC/RagA family outer membrane protein
MKFKYAMKNITGRLFQILLTTITLIIYCNMAPSKAFAGTDLSSQQPVRVTGTVTSASNGMPLPGLSIAVVGTAIGTITNQDGNYSIEVPSNATLTFSFIGFETLEIAVQGRSTIDVVMNESVEALQEVVVTALGIRREEKSLGFSVGRIDGEDLNRVVQENVLNSMAGKVSGVTINSTGGTGSTVSMVIRGATSMSTDNQPLFVVDGVPMANTVNNIGGFGRDNRVDYGNAIADIDPDIIESVSILKGPSAAALYGARAGNGVVLITTKKAKATDRMRVTVTSNTVFDVPAQYLNTQTRFSTGFFSFRPENVGGGILPTISPLDGTGSGPENDKGYWAVQWDAPLDANGVPIPTEVVSYPNNIKNFVKDFALTTTNGASITSSAGAVNYRLGVTNMTHTGLVPNSDLNRNSLSLAATSKVRKNLSISTDLNFNNTWADNRPSGNRGTNPMQWAYNHPANIDILKLRDYGTGNNIKRVSANHDNPYFLAYDVNNSFNRYRVFGNMMVNWEISPAFSAMARYTLNKTDETRETKIAPGYSQEPNNGAYGIVNANGLERNMDALLTYSGEWSGLSLTASAGGNLLYSRAASSSSSSKAGAGLIVPNVFTIQNISSGALDYSNFRSQKAINSVYGMLNFGYNEILFLDVTARNDWSSTLPSQNRSYFYPSASLSLMVDNIIDLGNNVEMFKIRGGVAQVGNDTSPYQLFATYGNAGQWGDAIRLAKPGSLLSPNLLPEEATSYEIGTDIRLFGNRLRLDGTYYLVQNRNQILGVPLAVSTGFSGVQINAGLLESKGIEFLLGVTPVKNSNWTWDLDFNFTKSDTWIKELTEEVEFVTFWDQARVRNTGYVRNMAEGHDGRVGNLYSRRIMRVTDPTSDYYGFPIMGSGLDAEWQGGENYSLVGNYNPDFILGLQSSLSYKNFSLNMTFDWRSGGQFVSQTWRYLTESVHSQTWLDKLVHPGELGGKASPELKAWVLENRERLLLADRLYPVGGPTPDYGGFPESFSGVTVYDGTFAPGVFGYHDANGKFILQGENLGNVGTVFLPYVVSYPWDVGEANMFDADYVKLREISLNYRFPVKLSQKVGMEDVNFAVYSRNIMLWTKDSELGIDPERAYQPEGGRFLQGVERYNADPWAVPIGFKLSFSF